MGHCRSDLAHKSLYQTRKTSAYLEDKAHKRHLGLEIPEANYIGLTTAATFERDVAMRLKSYLSRSRLDRSSTAFFLYRGRT